MKKTVVTFLIILIGLFLTFEFLGKSGEYSAEKVLWKINQEYAKVIKDPDAIPDATFNKIIGKYNKFIKDYPNSKLAPVAHILVARVHISKKDYATAINAYENVTAKFPDKPALCVQAVSEIGGIHSMTANWSELLKIYERILKEYPYTEIGLRTPLLVAQFYAQREDFYQSKKAFTDAITHYQKVIEDHPKTKIDFDARRAMSVCYLAQDKWREAVETMGETLLEFPQPAYWTEERADKTIKSINTISAVKLNDYNLPIKIYSQFVERYPIHPFSKTFKKIVASFELLKEENIEVQPRQ